LAEIPERDRAGRNRLLLRRHGVEISGQNYLLPRDVPKPQSGEASLVKNESLSVTQLLDDL
jgi:hypothetical protein